MRVPGIGVPPSGRFRTGPPDGLPTQKDLRTRAFCRRIHVILAILLLSDSSILQAAPPPTPSGPPTAEDLAAGQALAEHLRSAVPEENSDIHGRLIIKADGVTREIPIVCRVILNQTNWETDYETSATAESAAERLVIYHSTNGPNLYLYARAASPAAALPALTPLPAASATNSLAGSDFSLGDLGLEFLHWPVQRQLKGEMRLGQPCYVLESSNSQPAEIVRVRSDIDKESGGPLIADAYDAQGHIVKEYSLHGSSFKKVNGRWQLEKMDIRNKKTNSHTELKFDLNK